MTHPVNRAMPNKEDQQRLLSEVVATALRSDGHSKREFVSSAPNVAVSHGVAVGATLGNRYEILDVVGVGGWSTVYKVFDQNLDRLAAVKLMHAHLCGDQTKLMRFQREAESSSRLINQNLAVVYDYGELLPGRPYISMEFVNGIPLDVLLAQRRQLSVEEFIAVFNQVCDGLRAIHEASLIHRDLKPSNIMIDTNGHVKILDFGLVKWLLQEQSDLTKTNEALGSPAYMSPEQFAAEAIDARSDVYSLGCIAYEALTGFKPFATDSALKLMQLHTQKAPTRFRNLASHRPIAMAFEPCILRAMAKAPRDRFASAQEFKQALLNAGAKSTGIGGSHFSLPAILANASEGVVAGIRTRISNQGNDDSSSTASERGTRVLVFPEKRVGNVYLLLRTSKGELEHTTKHENVAGPLRVPQDALIELTDVPSNNLPSLEILFGLNGYDLTCLTLTNKELTKQSLQAICRLKGLESLNIDNARIDDTIFGELKLPHLRNLDVKNNPLTDSSMIAIGTSFPQLKSLNLRDTKITAQGVSELLKNTKLEGLDLSETDISDDALSLLATQLQLQYLKMTGVKITSAGINRLSALPTLKNLGLCETNLDDDSVPALVKLQTLSFLNVNHTNISSDGFAKLKQALPDCEILR